MQTDKISSFDRFVRSKICHISHFLEHIGKSLKITKDFSVSRVRGACPRIILAGWQKRLFVEVVKSVLIRVHPRQI